MHALVLSRLDSVDSAVEVVERKGLGHPDTICDALAETLSRNLCREYRHRFGHVLHHNVDKALLCGGRAAPAFGGGSVLSPIRVYLAGRATAGVGDQGIDVKAIAIEGSRSWVRANLHALDAERDVQFQALIEPGSQDLQDLFSRRPEQHVALANDTSIGVGYAPLSPLERLVLRAEQHINGRDRQGEHPAWGEDVKVMGLRCDETVHLTVACAMIGRHLFHIDDYLAEKAAIKEAMAALAAEQGFSECEVSVNAADDPLAERIYLTVTGTSAEAGDDGQVGRGNRINGLITPCRPMSLEAAAGKNPVTHVGKIYNVLAGELSAALVAGIPEIAAAHCLLASRIGSPVTSPAVLQVKLATRDGAPVDLHKGRVEDIAAETLARVPLLVDEFIAGAISVF
ncbi:MAG: methionine adenosyltransferase [Hyphomicrobiaceae bacterium]|nr:MAG: methionine adenosyltransferase [Hyphomicrobiaceae bacterium]